MYRLLALLLFLIAAPASAQFERLNQPIAPARGNAITPELVINGRAVPGGTAELAIFMRVKPGWHGYWLNPGDAGLPMSIEWKLPEGWSVGTLRYPVPHRLLVSGIVNYVYEDDYAVLTALKVPAGTTGTHRITAKMRWLACTDKICVPEQGEAEVEVSTGGMATSDPRFNAWRRALPQPLSTAAAFQSTGKVYRIAIPLPRSVEVKDPYVFPIDDGVVDYAAPQEFFRNGDRLVAHVGMGEGDPKLLRGVLALGDGRGLEFSAVPRPVGSSGTPLGGAASGLLLWALLGALAGGILLNLMPCVFPILAMKALHLARAGGDERAARREALGYGAGAVIGTAALGGVLLLLRAGGSAAGWAFQLQDPRTILILLLLATAITLNLLRLFELPVLGGETTRPEASGRARSPLSSPRLARAHSWARRSARLCCCRGGARSRSSRRSGWASPCPSLPSVSYPRSGAGFPGPGRGWSASSASRRPDGRDRRCRAVAALSADGDQRAARRPRRARRVWRSSFSCWQAPATRRQGLADRAGRNSRGDRPRAGLASIGAEHGGASYQPERSAGARSRPPGASRRPPGVRLFHRRLVPDVQGQ